MANKIKFNGTVKNREPETNCKLKLERRQLLGYGENNGEFG